MGGRNRRKSACLEIFCSLMSFNNVGERLRLKAKAGGAQDGARRHGRRKALPAIFRQEENLRLCRFFEQARHGAREKAERPSFAEAMARSESLPGNSAKALTQAHGPRQWARGFFGRRQLAQRDTAVERPVFNYAICAGNMQDAYQRPF
jgi:hypothetical protein